MTSRCGLTGANRNDPAQLWSVLEVLIPTDDHPGAGRAGVGQYVTARWRERGHEHLERTARAFEQLDAEAVAHGAQSFAALPLDRATRLLSQLESGDALTAWPSDTDPRCFVAELVQLAHEGFYADARGEPRQAPGWSMLGYSPGVA